MPSDTAFLGDMPSARSASAEYVSLGRTMDQTYPSPDFVGRPELSPRDISSAINNLRAIGITIDENNRVLRGLRMAVLTNYSLYALYSAYRAAVLARSARESVYAVAETAVMAAAQQWASIAAAVASSVAVYASFRAGWATAEYVHDYRADIGTPSGRRAAARQLEGTF